MGVSVRHERVSLIGLLDTPNSYLGQAGKYLRVKAAEDGTEFVVANFTVGGINKSVQFNDSTLLGGDSTFLYDKVTKEMTINQINLTNAPTVDGHAATKKYVDDSIAVENLWDRDVPSTTLNPYFSGDSVNSDNVYKINGKEVLSSKDSGTRIDSLLLGEDINSSGVLQETTVIGNTSCGSITSSTGVTVLGAVSAPSLTTGGSNTLIGNRVATDLVSGSYNTLVGARAGASILGSNNTLIGYQAGTQSTGSGLVCIGYRAGSAEAGSDKLYIANSSTANPLIYGDFNTSALKVNGTLEVTGKLTVGGAIDPTALILDPQSSAPSTDLGTTYYDSVDGEFKFREGSIWKSFSTGTSQDLSGTLTVNTINEHTFNNGVVIEGITLKDGDLAIPGDLTVLGSEFIASVENVLIEDNLLIINNGETDSGVTKGVAGLEVDRGTSFDYFFLFDESTDTFRVGEKYTTINITYGSSTVFTAGELIDDGQSDSAYEAKVKVVNPTSLIVNIRKGTISDTDLLIGSDSGATATVNGTPSVTNSLQAVATRQDFPTVYGVPVWNDTLKRFDTSSALTWNSTTFDITGGLNISGSYKIGNDIVLSYVATNNLFIGKGISRLGEGNIVVGNNAGLVLAAGASYNTLLGYSAGDSLTTADNCTLLGSFAGAGITTGGNNVCVGANTGLFLGSGSGNVFIGYSAGQKQVNETGSIMIGEFAGYNNTEEGNVLVGFNSGINSTSARDNTCVGHLSLSGLTTGDFNTVVGHEAGKGITTGISNTIIGIAAGGNNNFSGCILIGETAGNTNTSNNRLIIETNTSTDPLIYGEFDNEILSTFASLGIYTKTPRALLDTTPSTVGVDTYAIPSPTITTTQRGALTSMVEGCQVYDSTDNSLRLYNGSRWVALNNNTVIINSMSDFPAPTAGVIQLAADTVYDLGGKTLVTSDRFSFPTSGAYSAMVDGTIVYTGSNTLFSCTDVNGASINILRFTVSAATGSVFSFSTTAGGFVVLDKVAVGSCTSIGTFTGTLLVTAIAKCGFLGFDDGLTFSGTSTVVSISQLLMKAANNTAGCRFLEFTGTSHETVNIIAGEFTPKSNEHIFYFDPATSYTGATIVGSVINLTESSVSLSNVFDTGSLDQTSIYFKFEANTNIPASGTTAQGVVNVGSPITTSLPATSAQALLNLSTNWTWSKEERITGASDGTITYDGLEGATLKLVGNVELSPNSGTNQLLRTQFIKICSEDHRTVTFTNATNVINETATPRANGDRIIFYNTAGTLPAELREDIVYYVVNKATDSFQVSYTSGGAAVAFTDDGTPTNSYDVVELSGGVGRGQITNPLQFVPQALIDLVTGQQVALIVWNDTTANDIDSQYAYYRIGI